MSEGAASELVGGATSIAGPGDRSTQTSLWQPRRLAFWFFAAGLTLGTLASATLIASLVAFGPVAWVTSVLLLLLVVVPVTLLIRALDLYEREPTSILAGAFAWGALPAVALALAVEPSLLEWVATAAPVLAGDWGAAIVAPVVEEAAKTLGIALLVLVARDELDDLLDGFVWGAFVGVGFQAVENLVYFMRAYDGGSWDLLIATATLRLVAAGLSSHLLYSGLAGMGIAFLAARPDLPRQRRILGMVVLVGGGVAAHAFWNSPFLWDLAGDGAMGSLVIAAIVRGLPLILGLFLLFRLARRREARWFAAVSRSLLADGTLSVADLATLDGLVPRWRARIRSFRRGGRAAAQATAGLQRAQLAVAMTLDRHGDADHPEVLLRRAQVAHWRERVDRLAPSDRALPPQL